MQKRDDLDSFFAEVSDKLFNLRNKRFVEYFDKVYKSGRNTIYQKNMSQTKKFDAGWIETIESYFPSIDRITRKPRSNLKYEDDIVAVEKAKKITSQSIQHLASHSHLIKTIDEKNDMVIPSKVLTIAAEQDYQIYENRFVATLINRLFLFVRNRYLIIKDNVESFQKDHILTESKFDFSDVKVEMSIDLNVTKDLEDKSINEHNIALLKRAENLEKLVESLRGSQFMRLMRKAPQVRPPIMKTNIILKNADFKDAYNLWIFLDKYSALAYDVTVTEKDIEFDKAFEEHVKELVLINFATILGNQSVRNDLFNLEHGKTYTKRASKQMLSNAEDFVDDPSQIVLEDATLNEYFLEKYKKLLKQSQEEIRSTGNLTEDEALKRALRKTTDIVNGLFESIFEFESESNIFNYMVSEDLEKQYNRKKYQLKFSKIIRNIKQVDYNNSIRRERKLLKELQDINRQIINKRKEEIRNEMDTSKIEKLEKELLFKRFELDKYRKDLDLIQDDNTILDYEQDALEEARKEALNEIKVELDKYEEELKKRLKEVESNLQTELSMAKSETKETKSKLEKAINNRTKLLNKRINAEQKKILSSIDEEKKKLQAEYDEKARLKALEIKKKVEEERLRQEREEEELLQKEREEHAQAMVKAYEELLKAKGLDNDDEE